MKILLLMAIIGATLSVNAQAPQEAIDVCKNVISGLSCSFTTPQGKQEGICLQPPGESKLSCVPESMLNRTGALDKQLQTPPARRHTIIQSSGVIKTIKAETQPITQSKLTIIINGENRILKANGISIHLTGNFPNEGNPNAIQEQNYVFKIPALPEIAENLTVLGLHDFGLGVNGVPFDPGAAEWYLGDRQSGWQYEAMSGAITLGLDESHAHVQPTGAYHYHGLPSLLTSRLDTINTAHSPLVGWAADGFPIYALYGYKDNNDEDSGIIEMSSSYRLRKGERPTSGKNPGGNFDGTFVADYEYIPEAEGLDECNGRITRTPDFPDGTYAYFLTKSFPIIPRCYKGTPSTDFTLQRIR